MNRDNRLFAKSSTFQEAFPDVEQATIEWEESTLGIKPSGKRTESLKEIGVFIQCGNSNCHEGGYEIDTEILWDMISKKETKKEDILTCPGNERKGRSCCNGIKYTVRITYKS